MPDDSRLNRQFERLYAEQLTLERDDAIAEVRKLGTVAESLLTAIASAGVSHRDFDESFQSAAETIRNAWEDARSDLLAAIRNRTE